MPPGFHTTTREPKRAHLRARRFKTPPKFHEKTSRERQKEQKCAGEGKKSEILGGLADGGPAEGCPAEGGPVERGENTQHTTHHTPHTTHHTPHTTHHTPHTTHHTPHTIHNTQHTQFTQQFTQQHSKTDWPKTDWPKMAKTLNTYFGQKRTGPKLDCPKVGHYRSQTCYGLTSTSQRRNAAGQEDVQSLRTNHEFRLAFHCGETLVM